MNLQSGSLLVVDDDEMNRDMLSRRLVRSGYAVQLAASGQEALELIARYRFDVVLLDVMMPVLNGIDVLQTIRQTRSLSELPVIMVTAKDQSEDVVIALSLGANDYVVKPIDFPVAVARIQTQVLRKRAEEELQRHLSAMEASIDGMAILDDHEKYLYVNHALVKIFGYDAPADLIGKPWSIAYGDEIFRLQKEVLPVLRDGGRWRGEIRGARRDGGLFDQEISLAPIAGGGLVCVVRDITQRKWTERELQRARDAAEAANRAKSDFLANMSHEIRTPMNGIIGMTELALNTELTGEQRDYLQTAKQSADSLLRLLNDILDFSKIEAGKLELETIDFDLRDCIGDAVRAMAIRAHEKQLELAVHIPPDVPEALTGDPGRLRQIVVNLVGNAIKFTHRGEVVVDVKLESLTADEGRLHISVRDTGIGIPFDKQRLIFEAFSQADASTTRQFGGTGLGLAISSKLVALMGGKIWVESEPNQGSEFHFTATLGIAKRPLPKSRLDPAAVRDVPVLIIDDNRTNCRILEEMLTSWGMRSVVANDGAAGLDELRRAAALQQPFALVLLDVLMPNLDGFQVARTIRQTPALANARILLLSSAGIGTTSARRMDLGISRCLTKPIKQSDLLEAVMLALDGSAGATTPLAATPMPLHPASKPLRILLAEDSIVNQKVAVGLLTLRGHSVVVASSGHEALAALNRQTFDVVLMDVQMPDMDGFETTAALRRKEQVTGAHVPVVAMTAHAMKEDRARCLQAGMDGYVSKPVEPLALYREIERFAAAGSEIISIPEPLAISPQGDSALEWSQALRQVQLQPAFFREVATAFLEECPKLLAEIRVSMAAGDASRVRRAAHSLKSSAGVFAALPTANAARDVEVLSEQGKLSEAGDACATLEKHASGLLQALTATLASGEATTTP